MQQTKKAYANFRGTISGLHNRKKGDSKSEYEWGTKLYFFINTSEHNSIPVSITAWANSIGEDVYISTTDRSSARETKPIDWSKRNEEYEGWELIGIKVKGKAQDKAKTYVEHDAIQYIYDNFDDGDAVFVNCEVERSPSGETIYTNYNIKQMYPLTDKFDYEAEDFIEISDIKDTFVFKEMAVNEKRALVKGVVVNYGDKLADVEYVIDTKEEIDREIIKYIKENCSLGDVLSVEGIVHNATIGKWVETEGAKKQGNLVGRSTHSFNKNKSGKRFVVTGERKELQLIGIADLQKQVYTEDDLTVKEFDWLS